MTVPKALLTASPADLRKSAQAMSGKAQTVAHWSDLAVVLGRTEDEQLWLGWGFSSTRAFAEEELGIPPGDCQTLMGLWRTIQGALSEVPAEKWREISKVRALILRPVLSLGGKAAEWVDKAATLKSTVELRAAADKALDKKPDAWVTVKVAMPFELAQLFDAACVMALPRVLEDEPKPDPKRAQDRDVKFRCVEVILMDWVQVNAVQPPQKEE